MHVIVWGARDLGGKKGADGPADGGADTPDDLADEEDAERAALDGGRGFRGRPQRAIAGAENAAAGKWV